MPPELRRGSASILVPVVLGAVLLTLPVTAGAATPKTGGLYLSPDEDRRGLGQQLISVSRKTPRRIYWALKGSCGTDPQGLLLTGLVFGIPVDSKGRFSYSGADSRSDRFSAVSGPKAKHDGSLRVTLRGRFVTSRRITTLTGTCGNLAIPSSTLTYRKQHSLKGWPGDNPFRR